MTPDCENMLTAIDSHLPPLTVLDLFSGIGGFALGLERAGGFDTKLFCEIDPFCRRLLAKHWPDVPICADIRKLNGDEIFRPNVICGGFPCQDLSPIGKRSGIEGVHSGLWSEVARLVGILRPDYLIVENTSALLNLGGGRVFGDLASIGYDAEWHCIPASAVGAPHVRDRIWIIAYPPRKPGIHESMPLIPTERLFDDLSPWPTAPWASPEACICGVDDGIPDRVVRSQKLGNSVVPLIVEALGKQILKARERVGNLSA